MTLLLAFFVVMYAISSVNAGKYRVLSDSLFAAFRGAPRSLEPVQVGDKQVGTGADMNSTVVQQSQLEGKQQSRIAPVPVSYGSRPTGDSASPVKLPPQAAAAAQALSKLADQISQAMNQLVQKDLVTIRRSDFWIEVEMKTDILFPSGSARLADSAMSILEQLGGVLAPFPNPIRVEGHTDNKPIKTARLQLQLGAVSRACRQRRAGSGQSWCRPRAPRGHRLRRAAPTEGQRHCREPQRQPPRGGRDPVHRVDAADPRIPPRSPIPTRPLRRRMPLRKMARAPKAAAPSPTPADSPQAIPAARRAATRHRAERHPGRHAPRHGDPTALAQRRNPNQQTLAQNLHPECRTRRAAPET